MKNLPKKQKAIYVAVLFKSKIINVFQGVALVKSKVFNVFQGDSLYSFTHSDDWY